MVWTVKILGKGVGGKIKMVGGKMKMVEGGKKVVGGSKSSKMVGGLSKVVWVNISENGRGGHRKW